MIVLKFGGSSVKNSEWITRSLGIVKAQIDRAPVMVASAMGSVTDQLQDIAYTAGEGNLEPANIMLGKISGLHHTTAIDLLSGEILSGCEKAITAILEELKSIIKGLALLKQWTPRSNDAVLSFGERLSTTLIYYRALEEGIKAEYVDAREIIKTDNSFSSAKLLEDITYTEIRKKINPGRNKIYITQGFIASTQNGITTTLGRGGSDYTATIIGSALDAEEVQIWTDVDGIMTCDPKVVNSAVTLKKISYKEAQELAYFGARVIHPATIQPAIERNIPVVVRNTRNPAGSGTRIVHSETGKGIKAIAFKSEITIINILSSRMLLAYGFLKKIFEIFEKYETSVDLISTSEVSVSVTVDNTKSLKKIAEELSHIGTVSIKENNTIISLVGSGVWKNPETLLRVFNAVNTIPIRMVSLGSSDINLSFVVPGKYAAQTVQQLHNTFFIKE
ncbi:MAG: aspartate kinase [Spirochaetes bacterium]|nr:aspartate kinase [Spirochaetota bacterium]